MSLKSVYLLAYNLACTAGWALTLYRGVMHLAVNEGSLDDFWGEVELPLKIAQTAALLELLHSLLGLVKSPFMSTLLQVASRIWALWAIAVQFPSVRSHWSVALMVISWSLVEIPRYIFYALKSVNLSVPGPLLWLRYSLFIVLYPSGITGELVTMVKALPIMAAQGTWAIALPNTHNIAFSMWSLQLLALALYVPGSPFLYGHMLRQRRKVLKKDKGKKE
eukprot:PLAT511.1.p1 GENE.PLAT511.1~~PLAT511.1.p1  ORF type:complete len:221 (-),score=108.87 PLAT511.1:75-737(-)